MHKISRWSLSLILILAFCLPNSRAQDSDECALGTHTCSVNAYCNNTVGSFTCHCFESYGGTGVECDACSSNGYSYEVDGDDTGETNCACNTGFDGTGYTCQDVNECFLSSNSCNENAICSNSPGSYSCTCLSGYSGDGITCLECADHANAVYVGNNTMECSCNSGYSGDPVDNCSDVNECVESSHNCGLNATCTNSAGSFECECNNGFGGDGLSCTECSSDASVQGQIAGGTECTCNTGYDGDGEFCEDNNECELAMHSCDESASCSNTAGSFGCACDNGFGGDGVTCTQCDTNAHTTEVDSDETECVCNDGYVGDGSSCSDVEECTDGVHDCSENAICSNTAGSFTCDCVSDFYGDGRACSACATNAHADMGSTVGEACVCNLGYEGEGAVACEDTNECVNMAHNCDANAACNNTVGSFSCMCSEGFAGDGLECEACSTYAVSIWVTDSEDGVTECECATGFSGNGFDCEDVNECNLGVDTCHSLATCYNSLGSFECGCLAGYYGNGLTCTDCPDMSSSNANSTTVDDCVCSKGYGKNGTEECVNLNECDSFTHNCDVYGVCTDTEGSFNCHCASSYYGTGVTCTGCADNASSPEGSTSASSCVCDSGYSGTGSTSCTDKNECSLGTDTCAPDGEATCANTAGSFQCTCVKDFYGDGQVCTACASHAFSSAGSLNAANCTCSGGYYGDGHSSCTECAQDAWAPEGSTQSSDCVCNIGYDGDGVSFCENVDECTLGSQDCDEDAECIDIDGSFSCSCRSNFYGDGATCFKCDDNAQSVGGSTSSVDCRCNAGYYGDGVTCTSCVVGSSSSVGSESPEDCTCMAGFTGSGLTVCQDIKECSLGWDTCGTHTCVNTDGSFACIGVDVLEDPIVVEDMAYLFPATPVLVDDVDIWTISRFVVSGCPLGLSFVGVPSTDSVLRDSVYTLSHLGSGFTSDVALSFLSLSPPVQCDADFTLSVSVLGISIADAAENMTSDSISFGFQLAPVGDQPTMSMFAPSFIEDRNDVISITPALTDTDASELLTDLRILNVPRDGSVIVYEGAVYSFDLADTSDETTSDYIALAATSGFRSGDVLSFSYTAPFQCDVDFTFTVGLTSTEEDTSFGESSAEIAQTLSISVLAAADVPVVTTTDSVWTIPGQAVPLSITPVLVVDTDGSEVFERLVLSTEQSFVSILSEADEVSSSRVAGVTYYTIVASGTGFESGVVVGGLSVAPSNSFSGDFTLSVGVISVEANTIGSVYSLEASSTDDDNTADALVAVGVLTVDLDVPSESTVVEDIVMSIILPSFDTVTPNLTITWSSVMVTLDDGSEQTQSVVDATLEAASGRNDIEVSIPAFSVLWPGTLTITADVCQHKGDCLKTSTSIQVAECIGIFSFTSNRTTTTWQALEFFVVPSVCDDNAPIVYTWHLNGEERIGETSNNLLLKEGELSPGYIHEISSLVCVNGTFDCEERRTWVEVKFSVPVVILQGGSGTHPFGLNLVIDGSSTYHPDGVDMTYVWQCISVTTNESCDGLFRSYSVNTPVGRVPGTSLELQEYAFTLIVSDGLVSVSESVTVQVEPQNIPDVRIVSTFTDYVSPHKILTIQATVDVDSLNDFETISVLWSAVEISSEGDVSSFSLDDDIVLTSVTSLTLVLVEDSLEEDAMYEFRIDVWASGEQEDSSAWKRVTFSTAPSLEVGTGSVEESEVQTGDTTSVSWASIAMETEFDFTATGWEDPAAGSLWYRFYAIGNSRTVYITDWQLSSRGYGVLPAGSLASNYSVDVYVEVRSDSGAEEFAFLGTEQVMWRDVDSSYAASYTQERIDYARARETTLPGSHLALLQELAAFADDAMDALHDMQGDPSVEQDEVEDMLEDYRFVIGMVIDELALIASRPSDSGYVEAIDVHSLAVKYAEAGKELSADVCVRIIDLMETYGNSTLTAGAAGYTSDLGTYMDTTSLRIFVRTLATCLEELTASDADSQYAQARADVVDVVELLAVAAVADDAPGTEASCAGKQAYGLLVSAQRLDGVSLEATVTTSEEYVTTDGDLVYMSDLCGYAAEYEEVAAFTVLAEEVSNATLGSSFTVVHVMYLTSPLEDPLLLSSVNSLSFFGEDHAKITFDEKFTDGPLWTSAHVETDLVAEALTTYSIGNGFGDRWVCSLWNYDAQVWNPDECVTFPNPAPEGVSFVWREGYGYLGGLDKALAWELVADGCIDVEPDREDRHGYSNRDFKSDLHAYCALTDSSSGCYWNATYQTFMGDECVYADTVDCRCTSASHVAAYVLYRSDRWLSSYTFEDLVTTDRADHINQLLLAVLVMTFGTALVVYIAGRTQSERLLQHLASPECGAASVPLNPTTNVYTWSLRIDVGVDGSLSGPGHFLCEYLGIPVPWMLSALPILQGPDAIPWALLALRKKPSLLRGCVLYRTRELEEKNFEAWYETMWDDEIAKQGLECLEGIDETDSVSEKNGFGKKGCSGRDNRAKMKGGKSSVWNILRRGRTDKGEQGDVGANEGKG
eukprot:Rmarinus@m.18323